MLIYVIILIGSMKGKIVLKIIFILTVIFSILSMTVFFRKNKTENELIERMDKGFYLKGNDEVIIDYGSEYIDEGFVANIEENKSVKDIKIENNVDTNKVGNYEIVYTITYKDKTKSIKRIVKVVDNAPPTIEVNCKDTIYLPINSTFKDCSYTATDNYDKDVKVKIDSNVNTKKKGDYTVTYTAIDSSNNKTSKTINVYVRNKEDITYIVVSISKQKLYYYKNKELVLTTAVTTGRYNATKTGKFKVLNKVKNTVLKGKDYESKVKYWLGYSGSSFGIHDASWRSNFGTKNYYYVGSHGCVNVPIKNMKKLYNMVSVGTPVYIRK